MSGSQRTRRVGEEIRKVVSEQLIRGLRDPVPGFVTVREVEVNRDFTRAKVFYSVIGSDADKAGAQEVLDDNRGALRRQVGKVLKTRNTPELVFVLDETGERAARIQELLHESEVADAARAQGAAADDDDSERE
jgi:ribosome-binding factor A